MFYQILSQFYDDIFPAKQGVVKFLEGEFATSRRILDVPCGTGNYSLALAEKGYVVVALDLEETMIKQAIAKDVHQAVDFRVQNMLELDGLGTLEGAFCIGNSLAHLAGTEQIKEFLLQIRNVLQRKSRFIIQIVNFDRIMAQGDTELPTLGNDQIQFKRVYSPQSASSLIFHSELHQLESGSIFRNSIQLYPLRSGVLKQLLEECGFAYALYGDFAKGPYNPHTSQSIVVSAISM